MASGLKMDWSMNSFSTPKTPGPLGGTTSGTSGFMDPRLEKDFAPTFYPAADGAPAPSPESNDRDDRIKLEFCAVYCHLNRLYARLTDARRHTADRANSERRERELLQEIETH